MSDSALPICERLRAKYRPNALQAQRRFNQDGPKAADTIEALYEALESCIEELAGNKLLHDAFHKALAALEQARKP